MMEADDPIFDLGGPATREMTDHELCAIRLGKWTPRRECEGHPSAQGTVWCTEKIRHAMHDIPCPTLTSDEISEWLRQLWYSVEIYSPWKEIKSHGLVHHEDWLVVIQGEKLYEGHGATLLAALENAVAALPEAKE